MKFFAENIADFIQKIGGYTRVNTLVAQYGELSFFRDDEKKYAVPLSGLVHIQAEESLLSDVEHGSVQLVLQVYADFTGRAGLGLPDSLDDGLFRCLGVVTVPA